LPWWQPGNHVSHEIGARKPEPAAFRSVVADMGLAPDRVLFFDDSAENVAGARACGLRAVDVHDGGRNRTGSQRFRRSIVRWPRTTTLAALAGTTEAHYTRVAGHRFEGVWR
jgi:FMN phosphatase YigB (HAD superfamily)